MAVRRGRLAWRIPHGDRRQLAAGRVGQRHLHEPVLIWAVLWGALFLGEAVSFATAGGCALILLGVALTSGALRPGKATCQA